MVNYKRWRKTSGRITLEKPINFLIKSERESFLIPVCAEIKTTKSSSESILNKSEQPATHPELRSPTPEQSIIAAHNFIRDMWKMKKCQHTRTKRATNYNAKISGELQITYDKKEAGAICWEPVGILGPFQTREIYKRSNFLGKTTTHRGWEHNINIYQILVDFHQTYGSISIPYLKWKSRLNC